jgi:hypothetical protein
MRSLDFSAVKPGDIILTVEPGNLKHNPLSSLEYCYSDYVVMTTNSVDSLVMRAVSAGDAFPQMLVTKDGEGLAWGSLDGDYKMSTLSPDAVYHFTAEEYKQMRIDERISAQSKLARILSRWYKPGASFPEAVTEVAKQVMRDNVDEHMTNVNVANLEPAYKVMGEVIAASEKVYRETITANLDGMDDLIQRATTASAEIAAFVQSLNPWRNDGESVTLVRQYARGGYRISTQHSTFRVGSGIMTHSKDVYFIERVTKSRAYVSDPATGEQVGYLTTRKNSGVVLKFSDGSTETLDVLYQVIPASTPEDVLAYKAAYMEASRIMDELHGYIDQMKKSKLDGFNVACPSLSSLGALDSAYATAISTVSSLEREKSRVLEGMEATILKMKRLHQLAYGD